MTAPPANGHGPPVELRGLHKGFAGRPVLHGIDLKVKPGEIFVIMGPSGSGKSVLLKHVIGLEAPDLLTSWPMESIDIPVGVRVEQVFSIDVICRYPLALGEGHAAKALGIAMVPMDAQR